MTGQTSYHLGEISERYESAGPGTISTGQGDHGGVSYGTYQLSTNQGTLAEYLAQSRYRDEFRDLEPNTPAFNATWRNLADQDPGFGRDQTDFIHDTHYSEQLDRLKSAGIDLSDRGPSVREALFSTSVQYRRLTKNVFENGLKEVYGDHYDLTRLSDRDIVSAVQDYKLTHTEQLFQNSPRLWDQLRARASSEKDDLIALAEGLPLPERHAQHPSHGTDGTLRRGNNGEAVETLQGQLGSLGYADRRGQPLQPDGSFGPATDAAVRAFQHDDNLSSDGIVGPATQRTIREQIQSQSQGAQQQPQTLGRLDNPSHPDHLFFQQTRAHVYHLDQDLGRTPDYRSDNIASALTVQARADGLQRIDQIALSTDGSRLWAVQIPPGRNDHLFDLRTSTPTSAVNVPMEQSAAQWPRAMQQFQETQQQMQTHTQAQTQAQLQQTTQVQQMTR